MRGYAALGFALRRSKLVTLAAALVPLSCPLYVAPLRCAAAPWQADQSPLREVVFAIRAISPLVTFLVLVILLLVREPLPVVTVYTTFDGVDPEGIDNDVEGKG